MNRFYQRRLETMLKDLEGYRKNIQREFARLELPETEYWRRVPSWTTRPTHDEVVYWLDLNNRLIDYIHQCDSNGDDVAIQMLIDMRFLDRQAAQERHEVFRPAIDRGYREIRAGINSSNATHGTPEERRAKYEAWQNYIEAEHNKKPGATYSSLQESAASKFGVGKSTIEKHTKNPR